MTHFHTPGDGGVCVCVGGSYRSETRHNKLDEKQKEQYCHCQFLLSRFLGRGLILTTLDTLKLVSYPFLSVWIHSLPILPLLPFTLLFTHPDFTPLLCSFNLSSHLLHISLLVSHHMYPLSCLSHFLSSLPSLASILNSISAPACHKLSHPLASSSLFLLSSPCQFKQTMLCEWQNLLILHVTAA